MRRGPFGSRMVAGALFLTALVAVPWSDARAQSTGGSIRGTVSDENDAAIEGATVIARNTETNLQRGAATADNGFYNLSGLPPGPYAVEYAGLGFGTQAQNVRVQVGQSVEVDVQLSTEAIQLEGITSVVERERFVETTSPEVATNITQSQIENLPLLNRDFLSFAQLAPGVTPSGGSISSGGVDPENINLFIDGASFKNNVLSGGITGQDASDGNPFPQNAVQEFRVITQNYKAEYQKATGALITATTKSGTNDWEGGAFFLGQNEGFIGRDAFQACEAPGQPDDCVEQDVGDIGREQFGGSFGGPLVRDRLFFFGSYEGNFRDLTANVQSVTPANLALLPPAVADEVEAAAGAGFTRPLRSNLYFGKLSYQPADRHTFDFSGNVRDEYEIRGFGGFDARSRAEDFNNDVYTFIGRWQYSRGALLNEAHADWQRYHWNPIPLVDEVGRIYEGILAVGGRSTEQDFQQDRFTLRDDVTYTPPEWGGSHVFKAGTYVDFYQYDVTKLQDGNPQFVFRQLENFEIPFRASIGVGDPTLNSENTQIGLYAQDDYAVNDRLILNLGLRWDVETNMLNDDWVTPDSVREDVAQFLSPEQEARYFTDGGDRDNYLGAVQPRLGLTYDLTGEGMTTLFGGFAVNYDRTIYNNALDERFRLQFPVYNFRFSRDGAPDEAGNPTLPFDPSFLSREGLLDVVEGGDQCCKPEVFLLDNDTRPPKAYHFSAGVRQVFGGLTASASYAGVRGFNEFTWLFGNRRENGSCCLSTDRFGNVLLSDNSGKTWYNALLFQIGRPFSMESGWGAQVAYTLSESEQETFGLFTLDVQTADDFFRHPSDTDERHRLVGNAIVALPWDFRMSGILTLASARPISAFVGNDPNGDGLGPDFPEGETRNSRRADEGKFQQFDLRLDKGFSFADGQRVGVIAEVFNVFDNDNFGCFEQSFGNFNRDSGQIDRNESFGRPCGLTGDAQSRRLQLGLTYGF